MLVAAGELLKAAVTRGQRITPAGEWLLDNFYLIEEQIRTAKRHLPKAYSRELPRLRERPVGAACRASTTSRSRPSRTATGGVDAESLRRFVAAYQSGHAAASWASCGRFPIMLRLALIENLRRVAARVAREHRRARPRRRAGPTA